MTLTSVPAATTAPPVHQMTDEEARAYFDQQARHWLGITGEEFLRRWDAGEYTDKDELAIREMSILIPLAR